MGSKNKALKGTFQPQNSLKPEGSFMGRVKDTVGHTVSRFLPMFKDDSDEMSTHRAPKITSTQKPHRSGLVSQMASGSRFSAKRRQSPEVDELAEDDKPHSKRQRRSQDLKATPRIDVAALETRRAAATANRDADEVQRLTDQLEGKSSSSSTYQQTPKQAQENVDSDDELSAASPTRRITASSGSRISLNGRGSPLGHKVPKGDMRKTDFKGKHDSEITLSRAVSGKTCFDTEASGETIRLRLNEKGTFSLVPVNEAGQQLDCQWLTLVLKDCHRIKYLPESQHLVFYRPTKHGTPALLSLEIPSITDVAAVIRWIFGGMQRLDMKSLKLEQPTRESLQKTFEHTFQNATTSTRPDAHRLGDLENHSIDLAHLSIQQDRSRGLDPRLCRQTKPSPPPLTRSARPSERISLKDQMKHGSDSPPAIAESNPSLESPRSHRLERRTKARLDTPPPMAPKGEQWVDDHPDWADIWDDEPLIYPANGKNRAQVTKDDILRLEEHQYLNDNLIVFYLRYLQKKLEKDNVARSERILFMNPWFYERLSQRKSRGVDYDAVKSWTSKVDLLSKDYIIVPVNESAHWYLAIICNPWKLLPSTESDEDQTSAADTDDKDMPEEKNQQQKIVDTVVDVEDDNEEDVRIASDITPDDPDEPLKQVKPKKDQGRQLDGGGYRPVHPGDARVITLDSLGNTHSRTCTNLRDYLVQEIKHRRNLDIETPVRFGLTARGIPEQIDFSSCGVYLLAYVERFLKQPDQVVSDIVNKNDLEWSDINTVTMRGEIRELIIGLRQEQNAQRKTQKQAKQVAKAAKLAQKKQNAQFVDSPPANAPQTSGTIDPGEPVQDTNASSSDPPYSGNDGHLPATEPRNDRSLSAQNKSSPSKSVRSPSESSEVVRPTSPASFASQAVKPLIDSSDIDDIVAGHKMSLVPPIQSSSPAILKTPKRKRSSEEFTTPALDTHTLHDRDRPLKTRSDGKEKASFVPEEWSILSSPSGDRGDRTERQWQKHEMETEKGNSEIIVVIDGSPKSKKSPDKITTSHHFKNQSLVGRRSQRVKAPASTPLRGDGGQRVVYGGTRRRSVAGGSYIDLT